MHKIYLRTWLRSIAKGIILLSSFPLSLSLSLFFILLPLSHSFTLGILWLGYNARKSITPLDNESRFLEEWRGGGGPLQAPREMCIDKIVSGTRDRSIGHLVKALNEFSNTISYLFFQFSHHFPFFCIFISAAFSRSVCNCYCLCLFSSSL